MPATGSVTFLPERLLDLELWQGQVRPRYLTSRDLIWVEALTDTLHDCAHLPRAEVERRLSSPVHLGERPAALRALVHLLLRLHRFKVLACADPLRLRAALFEQAAASGPRTPRGQVLAEAARSLGVRALDLERQLYADMPAERILVPLACPLGPAEVIERYNLALVQGLLLRAEGLFVHLQGNVKAVLRYARLQRLLCQVSSAPRGGGTWLHLTGPLSLFHHTTKYGRALACWLPAVIRAPRWEVQAACVVGGERCGFRATWRDPIGTTHVVPLRFDSALEERLFRDLRRLAPGWQVLREADAVQVKGRILSPDFTLVHPGRGLRVLVEVVGFWTPEYLERKMDALASLPADQRWLVCMDEALAAGAGERLPAGSIFWFKRRIDARALLEHIERVTSQGGGCDPACERTVPGTEGAP